ncbi:Coronin-2A, partial [Eschrichtius robustus]|nr:Coronin-2A [Eschrichtius robustus]
MVSGLSSDVPDSFILHEIKIWDIPKQLLAKNLTAFKKELVGHARRVGLVEWHPTAASILFSSGYDYKEASYKGHRASKVLFLGNLKKLLSTGTSRWNNRQMALWDQDDLSVPLAEEDLDGSSGVLFPFYDSDTNMLYVVGKGDGNIRYYEVSTDKPHLNYLTEYRSYNPQKGI